MATQPNPFTILHDALWALFEDDENFTAIVAEGNRLKYNSETNRQPIKESITTADLPEFAITFDGLNGNLQNTSSTSRLNPVFRFIVNTGDFRFNEVLAVINWLVICNLVRWCSTLTALEWKGYRFVKAVRILESPAGESDPDRNRNIKGWVTVWRIEIECHFPTSDLVFSENPGSSSGP